MSLHQISTENINQVNKFYSFYLDVLSLEDLISHMLLFFSSHSLVLFSFLSIILITCHSASDSDSMKKLKHSFSFAGVAFMQKPTFYQAFVICIRTVESSNPSLLVTIDPKLVGSFFCEGIANSSAHLCSVHNSLSLVTCKRQP